MNLIQSHKEAKKALGLQERDRVPCEIWTRVMGYHRPVSSWNIGKKQEFKDRTPYGNIS